MKFWPLWPTWCGMALCWHAFWHILWYILWCFFVPAIHLAYVLTKTLTLALANFPWYMHSDITLTSIYSSNFSEMHSGNPFWHWQFVFSWHIFRHIFLIYILTFIWGFAKMGNRSLQNTIRAITSEHTVFASLQNTGHHETGKAQHNGVVWVGWGSCVHVPLLTEALPLIMHIV